MATARPGMQDGRALTCYMQSSDINNRLKRVLNAADSTQYRYILQAKGHDMANATVAELAKLATATDCRNPTTGFACTPYHRTAR